MNYYPLDSINVPIFYTVKDQKNGHESPLGTVFAVSSDHGSKGWMSLGYVSRQSPMGQGTYLGFPLSEIREAMPNEVLAALEKDHPHGKSFRPGCKKAMDASFHLTMASAVGNWTTDGARKSGRKAVVDVPNDEIRKYRDDAIREHTDLMARWEEITAKQIEAIQESFGINLTLKRIVKFFEETFGKNQ